MFTKLLLLLSMCLMMMGATNCATKLYLPPKYEDCTVITSWSPEKQTDVATCFCLDDRLVDDKSFQVLYKRAEGVLKEHPLQAQTLEFLKANKDEIIKLKEYELPVSYCRGYTAINPPDRTALTVWAEDNRTSRISCELGVIKK